MLSVWTSYFPFSFSKTSEKRISYCNCHTTDINGASFFYTSSAFKIRLNIFLSYSNEYSKQILLGMKQKNLTFTHAFKPTSNALSGIFHSLHTKVLTS